MSKFEYCFLNSQKVSPEENNFKLLGYSYLFGYSADGNGVSFPISNRARRCLLSCEQFSRNSLRLFRCTGRLFLGDIIVLFAVRTRVRIIIELFPTGFSANSTGICRLRYGRFHDVQNVLNFYIIFWQHRRKLLFC